MFTALIPQKATVGRQRVASDLFARVFATVSAALLHQFNVVFLSTHIG